MSIAIAPGVRVCDLPDHGRVVAARERELPQLFQRLVVDPDDRDVLRDVATADREALVHRPVLDAAKNVVHVSEREHHGDGRGTEEHDDGSRSSHSRLRPPVSPTWLRESTERQS